MSTQKIIDSADAWVKARCEEDWFYFVPLQDAARGLVQANCNGLDASTGCAVGQALARAILNDSGEVQLDKPIYEKVREAVYGNAMAIHLTTGEGVLPVQQ